MNHIKIKIKNIIDTMNQLTNLEYAIFDVNSKLIISTDQYLLIKGNTVHSKSIKDVLDQGDVIVNKPGEMPSCIGCRFVNNCPSTIEILSCIKTDNKCIGIVSVTAFTKKQHNMIKSNINSYIKSIKTLSNLIVIFYQGETLKNESNMINEIIETLIQESKKNYIIIDKSKNILYSDTETQKNFFSHCNLYTQSIEQVFPEDVLDWIFSVKLYNKKSFNIRGINYTLHIKPIKTEVEAMGYIIKLEKMKENDLIIPKNNYLDSIISKDKKIKELKEKIKKVSNSPSSVLITGETGTGKEMFAKALHHIGHEPEKPFISINCSNIPESLFESEMFGYEEGAFTGAKKGGKVGLFEMANGGSLFLDEIGELPIQFQAKLLRVLQENTIQRIGSINTIPINIRLISATNANIEQMIQEGKFREDLFYRINVIPLKLPTLNERPGDIELLAKHFVEKYSNKLNKEIHSISETTLKILNDYTWPGNIRELENTIEYGINMEDSNILLKENLPDRIKKVEKYNNLDLNEQLLDTQIQIIKNELDKNGWDLEGKEKTAKSLGISLRTLYRKIKDEDIRRLQ